MGGEDLPPIKRNCRSVDNGGHVKNSVARCFLDPESVDAMSIQRTQDLQAVGTMMY